MIRKPRKDPFASFTDPGGPIKGKCSRCFILITLIDGRLAEHRFGGHGLSRCAGSGNKPLSDSVVDVRSGKKVTLRLKGGEKHGRAQGR